VYMDTVHIERTRVQNQLSFLWRERIMDLYTGKTAPDLIYEN